MTIFPHESELNAIEIFFGFIKQKIYKKIFQSEQKLIKCVEKILKENNDNQIICKIFVKSLTIYKKKYIEENLHIDLNKN